MQPIRLNLIFDVNMPQSTDSVMPAWQPEHLAKKLVVFKGISLEKDEKDVAISNTYEYAKTVQLSKYNFLAVKHCPIHRFMSRQRIIGKVSFKISISRKFHRNEVCVSCKNFLLCWWYCVPHCKAEPATGPPAICIPHRNSSWTS